VLKQRNKQSFYPGDDVVERTVDPDTPEMGAALIAAERRAAVLEALALLPEHCRQLIELLVNDDRPSYAEIGSRLQMPIGSIGPTRSRCLDKLRASPVLRDWAPGSPTDSSEY
jgi:DNA-directed RNA polymerase specialized sigma24 family protein